MADLLLPALYVHERDPEDRFAPTIIITVEPLTDEEARDYADAFTPEEAREALNALLMEEEEE